MSEVRKRHIGKTAEISEVSEKLVEKEVLEHRKDGGNSGKNSYWLTRIVYLRAIGTVYFVAFLVAIHQNRALIGTKEKIKIILTFINFLGCIFMINLNLYFSESKTIFILKRSDTGR